MSDYLKIVSRKRKWTPVAVDKGVIQEGSEDTLKRCLALRTLELPVKEMLQQGMDRELPDNPGILPALQSNMADEEKHDRALNYIVDVHGTDSRAEAEAERIRAAWLSDPSHPILKTAILERSVFFVLLPFFRFNGDVGIRTVAADISRDEQTHSLVHAMVAHDLGEQPTPALNKLRKATVHWAMDLLGTGENKYLNKDFWLKQSDNLYSSGKAQGLAETQRARMPSFFETSNVNLPKYG
mgnify:CR=1 FL=1